MRYSISGLIAATYTPMHNDGSLYLEQVPRIVDYLIAAGIQGLYVCGTTGEGVSLTTTERKAVAEAYLSATKNRLKVAVHVGHESLSEARNLASHAQEIGADIVSATAPSFFRVDSADLLVQCMAEVASGAPNVPFYYYHIPALTGVSVDMVDFLQLGAEHIENLAGLKYTTPKAFEYQACLESVAGRFDILWGCDEMLLSALAVGAKGAIGSTFNIAAPLYRRIIESYHSGDLDEARRCQSLSMNLIRRISRYPFHPAMKEIMKLNGLACGRCRLPQPRLSVDEATALRRELEELDYFDWPNRFRTQVQKT